MASVPPGPRNVPLNFQFYRDSHGSLVGLQPPITNKLGVITAVFRKHSNPAYELTITAGQEWHHGHGLMSRHHSGNAIDLRTRDLPGGSAGTAARFITNELRQKLGPLYYIQNEVNKHHIHIEFRAGVKMSNPGDFELNMG